MNRNKESVGWDLKDPEDQRRAAALAARADVVVHNLKPGTMERLSLGYDDVARENPSVVYAAVPASATARAGTCPATTSSSRPRAGS